MEKLEDELRRYELSLGIPGVTEDEVTQETRRLLSIPPRSVSKMTALECGEAAYCLEQSSMRIQQALNQHEAKIVLAEESIAAILAGKVSDYRGATADERRRTAVKDSEPASRWEQVRVKALVRVKRLSFLANKVEKLTMTLLSIQSTKRGKDD